MHPSLLSPTIDRRSLLRTLGGLALALATPCRGAAAASHAERKRLELQPLGPGLAAEHVETAKLALEAFYPLDVVVLPSAPLPRSAYYAPRGRYRAEKLLAFLGERATGSAYRILGLTAVDISTTKGSHADWGILGLATIDGRACVLSAFRCKKPGTPQTKVSDRLGKTAVHEIGHTLGLEHCPTYGCLMEDARGTVLTTDREYDLCPRCRQQLERTGRSAKSDVAPPWPKPSSS